MSRRTMWLACLGLLVVAAVGVLTMPLTTRQGVNDKVGTPHPRGRDRSLVDKRHSRLKMRSVHFVNGVVADRHEVSRIEHNQL